MAGNKRSGRIHSAVSTTSSSFNPRAQQWRMEEAASRRREAATRDLEYWTHTSKYFDTLQKQNDRFEAWSSEDILKKR